MKTSLTKLSSSLFLLSFTLGSFAAVEKPVAQVVEVTGTVFAVTSEGKTTALKANDHLGDKTEIMVEEGGSVTINDYYDATYHMIGGSHLKFFNKSVQLKKGKTWIQSMNTRYPLALTTANGHIGFWKSEFIATFDQATNKSQFLMVNGEAEVSNVLDQDMKYTVPAGEFSFIDPKIENGTPRAPTKVGLDSLNTALAEFKRLPEKIKSDAPARAIASVEEKPAVKKGQIIFMTSSRMPASVPMGTAQKYFKKLTAKAPVAAPVPIKIYGTSWNPISAPRSPASIKPISVDMPKKEAQTMKNDPEFVDSLKRQEAQQPKYSEELESLIDELQSY